MYDFYYNRLLGDPEKFVSRDGIRYLEIWDYGDGSSPIYEENDLDESQISEWLHRAVRLRAVELFAYCANHCRYQTARVKTSTMNRKGSVLIGSPEEHENDAKILPLPISSTTFEEIRTTWNMPTELLRVMLSTLPISTQYSIDDKDGNLRAIGLLIRGGRSRDWNYCLALSYDVNTGVSHAILQGLEAEEITLLCKCLRYSQAYIKEPMLLPLFLIELKIHFFAVLLERRALALEEIEYDTGMTHGFSEDPKRNPALDTARARDTTKLDFGPITQKLTSSTGSLAFCDLTFKSGLMGLELIEATNTRINECGVNGTIRIPRGPLHRRITYIKGLILGAQAHTLVLRERTTAQVQTVYSMIGQRDNRLNIETAEISRRIAENTLRDSKAMREIAEDSKEVSLLTRRDSVDMRIITAITLFFLPGTFTATFFSSSFFDFHPRQASALVSNWIWLYVVITISLTAIVLVAWYYFSRKEINSISQTLGLNKDTRQTWGTLLEEGPTAHHSPMDTDIAPISATLSPRASLKKRRNTSIARIAEEGPYTMVDLHHE